MPEIHLKVSSYRLAIHYQLSRRLLEAKAELPRLIQRMLNDGEILVLVAQDGSTYRADNYIALKLAMAKNVDECRVKIWIIQEKVRLLEDFI